MTYIALWSFLLPKVMSVNSQDSAILLTQITTRAFIRSVPKLDPFTSKVSQIFTNTAAQISIHHISPVLAQIC